MFTNSQSLTKLEFSNFVVSLWKAKEERSVSVWTPLGSVSVDLGKTLFGDEDEFGVQVRKRAWGLVFYGRTGGINEMESSRKGVYWFHSVRSHPEYEKERVSSPRSFNQSRLKDIDAGKAKDPINMTPKERTAAVRNHIRSLKWSRDFVHNMTTPMVYLALENGGKADDGFGGGILLSEEQMEILKGQLEKGEKLNLPSPIETTDLSWNDVSAENLLESGNGNS